MSVRDHVRPVRFSEHVTETAAFYELLGLDRVEARGSGWAVLAAGRGALAVHEVATNDSGAAHGDTHLSFTTTDADALAADLRDAGATGVTVYDEAYGRTVSAVAADGGEVRADEEGDGHGYERRDPTPDPRWTVRPVWYVAPDHRADAQRLLGALGLVARAGANPWWTACDGPGGAVGLHGPLEGRPRCELGLETAEPLDEVAVRLAAAGHPAEVTESERVGRVLRTTDPDGCVVEVHVAP